MRVQVLPARTPCIASFASETRVRIVPLIASRAEAQLGPSGCGTEYENRIEGDGAGHHLLSIVVFSHPRTAATEAMPDAESGMNERVRSCADRRRAN